MNKRKWWNISNSVSILFVVLIVLIGVYSHEKSHDNNEQLTDQKKVDDYLNKNFPEIDKNSDNLIPTGVFIQSLKFNNSSEVNLTGYVWQIYKESEYKGVADDKIPVGFILPETVDSGSNIEEPKLYLRRNIKGNKEVIAWYFEATLKQRFDYSKYPFDHKTVWIRFWSKDRDKNKDKKTILIPSFESYKSTESKAHFGYDDSIVLGHWRLLNTYFNYREHEYNHAFGTYNTNTKYPPELYFNILIKRRFLNSFIIYILPLLIIASLVFATLMMMTKNEKQSSIFGIHTSGVIGVCSGLFFVILISQTQIREQFAGSRTVYVEYFYPLMYISLLGISVNSYLLSSIKKDKNSVLKWIDYEDNIIPKLIFWPVLLGSATIISAVILLPEGKGSISNINKKQEQSLLFDQRLSGKTALLPFNLDNMGSNPTKTTYQAVLPMSRFELLKLHSEQKITQPIA